MVLASRIFSCVAGALGIRLILVLGVGSSWSACRTAGPKYSAGAPVAGNLRALTARLKAALTPYAGESAAVTGQRHDRRAALT